MKTKSRSSRIFYQCFIKSCDSGLPSMAPAKMFILVYNWSARMWSLRQRHFFFRLLAEGCKNISAESVNVSTDVTARWEAWLNNSMPLYLTCVKSGFNKQKGRNGDEGVGRKYFEFPFARRWRGDKTMHCTQNWFKYGFDTESRIAASRWQHLK